MWLFWIVAGLLAAAAAALITARAAAAARRSGEERPELAVYRRQLAEIDELADRGLLGADEHRAARAEAARRLLGAADRPGEADGPAPRGSRAAVTLGAAAAALAALGLYLVLGSPGIPDQPYRARVHAWRRADPSTLTPAQMAAVLREFAAARPRDPQVHDYLGRAELASGDGFAAGRAFEQAIRLGARSPQIYGLLGQSRIVQAQGKVGPDARAAFEAALKLDPGNAPARYFVGRAQIEAGERAQGLSTWRALAGDLPAADPSRPALLAEIAQAEGRAPTPALSGPKTAAGQAIAKAPAAEQAAFIRGMVASLAARLKSKPDDPQGWARLVRAYGVLGDAQAQAGALASARRLFANQPEALAAIEAEAKARPAP